MERISALGLNYVIIIAFSIMIGEFGDKTFIASIGLGINYPNHKIGLLIGAILGMIFSNCFAIFLGKFMKNKISENAMEILSGIIFLVFGFIGIFSLYFYNS